MSIRRSGGAPLMCATDTAAALVDWGGGKAAVTYPAAPGTNAALRPFPPPTEEDDLA